MAKVIKYYVHFRGTNKELVKEEFAKLYDLMKPNMTLQEREALDMALAPESKNDHIYLVFDPNNESGYKEALTKILL